MASHAAAAPSLRAAPARRRLERASRRVRSRKSLRWSSAARTAAARTRALATSDPPRTDKKVVVVTGGARGIGAACCLLLARKGWAVAINHRASSAEAAEALARTIREEGGDAMTALADVGVEADVVRMFETVAAWGPLAGLVNNAGVLFGPNGSKTVADADAADLEAIFRVNALGPVLCTREATRYMSVKSGGGGGSIVNVSSGSAVIGRPLLYAMSKGALNSFQAGAVDELAAHGIRINSVSPGMTNTELGADVVPTFDFSKIPLGRIGEPEEIAEGVAFLLGETGSYCSGANIRIAGGRPPGTFLG